MSYRPEGWPAQKLNTVERECKKRRKFTLTDDEFFEAGADAAIEALKAQPTTHKVKGGLVIFIPDKEEA